MKQIIAACECLHDRKIIHRNLTITNILLDENLNCKLCDFGISAMVEDLDEKNRFGNSFQIKLLNNRILAKIFMM